MSARPERKKMCWNCEGNIPIHAEDCPYCQAALMPPEIDDNVIPKSSQPLRPLEDEEVVAPVRNPYGLGKFESLPQIEQEPVPQSDGDNHIPFGNEMSAVALTMALLMGGLVFFLFGGVLWLFSSNGYLVLRWDNSYSWIYLGLGLFMLLLGFKSLGAFDSNEET